MVSNDSFGHKVIRHEYKLIKCLQKQNVSKQAFLGLHDKPVQRSRNKMAELY